MADQANDWRTLCEAAAKEHDPDKFLALIIRLNQALDERDRRLSGGAGDNNNPMPRSSAAAMLPRTTAESREITPNIWAAVT